MFEFKEKDLSPLSGYPERDLLWFIHYILPHFLNLKESFQWGNKLLDVGCAYGYFTQIYASYFEYVTGIDISKDRIEGARKYHQKNNIRYLTFDLRSDFLNELFDCAVSSAVFQHISLDKRVNAFQTIAHSLKSEGDLILYDESYDKNPYNWDYNGFEPISPSWIQTHLKGIFKLIHYEKICQATNGAHIFNYILIKV